MSMTGLLAVVACIAFNIWLFRIGPLWGIIGLNISKHVLIAYVCQVLGVDRKHARDRRYAAPSLPTHVPAR